MSTPFTDVYSIFLNDITDRKFVDLLTPEELGDILEDYLMESTSIHFKQCKKDLNDIDDVNKSFNQDLTREEKTILAKGMKLKWLDSNYIANESKLAMRLTTKDYKVFSPSNHLKVLVDIKKDAEKEIKALVISYLYDHWKGGN